MTAPLTLPKLGLTMEAAVVLRWLVAPGTLVETGQPVVEVETDKVEVEVTAETSGYLEPLAPPGSEITVGGLLGHLHDHAAAATADRGVASAAAYGAPDHADPSGGGGAAPSWRGLRASMAARALARRHGVDLASLTGSGPGGRVVAADVERAAAEHSGTSSRPATINETEDGSGHSAGDEAHDGRPPLLESVFTVRLAGRRGAVARHLEAARAGAVPLTLNRFTPCGGLVALRRLAVERCPDLRPTVTEVAARLVAAVVSRHPSLNARAVADGAECFTRVHLGVAVDTDEGLVVPVVHDADRLGVAELAAQLRAVTAAARERRLSPGDLDAGTFTLTNLGAYGIDFGTPVLNWPQVAILGLGRVTLPAEGTPTIGLSLTVDHRLIDGVPAARFLDDVAGAFADAGSLLL